MDEGAVAAAHLCLGEELVLADTQIESSAEARLPELPLLGRALAYPVSVGAHELVQNSPELLHHPLSAIGAARRPRGEGPAGSPYNLQRGGEAVLAREISHS